LTSISSGASLLSNVSCVPQRGQKVLLPFGVDWKRVTVPKSRRKASRGTLNQATKGAPAVRRQIEQWQLVSLNGVPAASYRTAPQ